MDILACNGVSKYLLRCSMWPPRTDPDLVTSFPRDLFLACTQTIIHLIDTVLLPKY